jgi:hypothetical protein
MWTPSRLLPQSATWRSVPSNATAACIPAVPDGLSFSRDEWTLLLSTHANVLVVAPEERIETLMSVWLPHLEPVHRLGTSSKKAPDSRVRTILIENVEDLTLAQQRNVLQLLAGPSYRFISLSRKPIYEMVRDGRFLEDLYYALNTIYLSI